MKIQPDTLDLLFKKYKHMFEVNAAKLKPEFDLALQAIATNLDKQFAWDEIANNNALDNSLTSLVKASLKRHHKTREFKFDIQNSALACHKENQKFLAALGMKLASPPGEQGIQENFLKSQKHQDFAITITDIKRQIVATDMAGIIAVVEPTTKAFGMLFINHQRHDQAINKGSNTTHDCSPIAMMFEFTPGTWVSAVISLDLKNNTASYKLSSSAKLTKNDEARLCQIIKDSFKLTLFSEVTNSAIEAYPAIKIKAPTISMVDNGGALRILHDLYTSAALQPTVDAKDAAQEFKSSKENLRQAFIDKQISSIKITPEVLNLRSLVPKAWHELVDTELQTFNLSNKLFKFPKSEPNKPLKARDYQMLLLRINEKLVSGGISQALECLEIKLFNSYDIQGLSRLKNNLDTIPCKQLNLTLPLNIAQSQKQAFLFHFKLALVNLNQLNLERLNLTDTGNILNKTDIAYITTFIEKNCIGIDINLPVEYVTTAAQRSIDIASDNFRMQRNAENYKRKNDKVCHVKVPREIRTRPKISNHNVSIDIELQQEIQVAVAVSNESQSSAPQVVEARLWDKEMFIKAIKNNSFSSNSKSYLSNVSSSNLKQLWANWFGCLNERDFERGMKSTKAALEELLKYSDRFQYGIGFTKRGNTYNNLPPGFSIQTKANTTYLDFSSGLKRISTQDLLAVNTKTDFKIAKVPLDLISKWAANNTKHPFAIKWCKELTAMPYNKNSLTSLQHCFATIVKMPFVIATELFSYGKKPEELRCVVDDGVKMSSLHKADDCSSSVAIKDHLRKLFASSSAVTIFLKDAFPVKANEDELLLKQLIAGSDYESVQIIKHKLNSINTDGLLQLYLKTGIQGVKDLSTLLAKLDDEKLAYYQKLNGFIFSTHGAYEQILSKGFQTALQAITKLPDNEKAFFDRLIAQHARFNTSINLAELFDSFVTFKIALNKLAPNEEAPFVLPHEFTFEAVKSLPSALARILAIVEHTSLENRQAQLLESSKLDLSSRGAIQIVMRKFGELRKRWNFVSAKMNFSQVSEAWIEGTLNYAVPTSWRYIEANDQPKMSQNFFRFAAFQSEKDSLPLEFYEHVDIAIKDAPEDWSNESKKIFYSLVSGSCVGEANKNIVCSTKQIIADFDILFEKVNNPPNPLGAARFRGGKDNLRFELIRSLVMLAKLPPLLILTNLVCLIATSLSSIFGVAKNISKLTKACNSLEEMVRVYDSGLYKGLANYSAAKFNDPELFYSHMDTIETIHKHSSLAVNFKGVLIQLISTFNLNPNKDLAELLNIIAKYKKPRKLYELLRLLKRITPENYVHDKPLTHIHLKQLVEIFISQADRLDNQAKLLNFTNQILKETAFNDIPLSDYFDKRFIKYLGKKAIPYETDAKIEHNFNAKSRDFVRDILLRFTGNTDIEQYNNIVEALSIITKPLRNFETNLLLKKISKNDGLFLSNIALSDEGNIFVKLLAKIQEARSPDDCLNFLAGDRKLLNSSPDENKGHYYQGEPLYNKGFDQKIFVYLDEILPSIRAKDLGLSELEITPLMQELVLKSSVAEISNPSEFINPDIALMEAYLQVSHESLSCFSKDSDKKTLRLDELKAQATMLISKSNLAKLGKEALKGLLKQIVNFQKVSNVHKQDLVAIATNPQIALLTTFFSNQPDENKKSPFEKEHDDFINALQSSPVLVNNKSLITVLFRIENKFLFNKVMQGDSLKALKSSKLLKEKKQYDAFIKALEEDVEALATFKTTANEIEALVKRYKKECTRFSAVLVLLVEKIANLVSVSPNVKGHLFKLLENLTKAYDPNSGSLLRALHNYLGELLPIFNIHKDKNILLSLCMQFKNSPKKLALLLQTIKQHFKDFADLELLLTIAVKLLNNEKGYILKALPSEGFRYDFESLCQMAGNKPLFLETLRAFYAKPPYPSLSQIIIIHNNALEKENYKNAISQKLGEFDL